MARTTEKEPPAGPPSEPPDDTDARQLMAQTLLDQAQIALKQGKMDVFASLSSAASVLMGGARTPGDQGERVDGRKQTTPETEKIKAMLREGWREASELQEATGLNANRVHSLLGRLKNSRELRFEKRTLVQYRLIP